MLYHLRGLEICPYPIFFSELVLDVILEENIKNIGIIDGKNQVDKELKFKI